MKIYNYKNTEKWDYIMAGFQLVFVPQFLARDCVLTKIPSRAARFSLKMCFLLLFYIVCNGTVTEFLQTINL